MSIHIRHRRRRQIFPLPLLDANCELELFQSRIRARKRPALRRGASSETRRSLKQLAQMPPKTRPEAEADFFPGAVSQE